VIQIKKSQKKNIYYTYSIFYYRAYQLHHQTKMRRLQQLIQSNLVWKNDILYFHFKKNKFTCEITQGGLIWKCCWTQPGGEKKELFRNSTNIDGRPYIRTFESLTDWTETCIQECLDEYHTRYSSWKRVRHLRLDQPMETIYKHYQQKKTKSSVENCVGLFEQIAGLTIRVDGLKKDLTKWEEWYVKTHPDSEPPFQTVSNKTQEQKDEVETSTVSQTQPFVLNSAEGQFMVLQKLNTVASEECKSWLKKNGESEFREMLDEVQERGLFEPVDVNHEQNWSPVNINTAKTFVHAFFGE
jgi:hypothetical protein